LDLLEEVEITQIPMADAVVLPEALLESEGDGPLELLADPRVFHMPQGPQPGESYPRRAVAPGHGEGLLGRRRRILGYGGTCRGVGHPALQIRPEILPLEFKSAQGGLPEAPIAADLREVEQRQSDAGSAVREAGLRLVAADPDEPGDSPSRGSRRLQQLLAALHGRLQSAPGAVGS